MSNNKFNKRKLIRYFRWATKAAFLLFFVFPLIYLVGAPDHYVYSSLMGLNSPFLALPYGQSVCTIWTFAYGQIGPGAWLICPLGGLQTIVTGQVDVAHFLLTMVALLLFLVPIFLLGNFFCGWICPLGTIVDSFDNAVSRFLRKVEAKRSERMFRSKEKAMVLKGGSAGLVACPACPFSRLLGNRFGGAVANSIIVSSLVGSAIFKFPVFCSICPIGITTRGMFNLKAWTYLTGVMMPIIVELAAIPIVAVLMSLREKRYWCRKICPVGTTLNVAGSFSPFVKPKVNAERCVMKECPKTCEDYKLDFCGACRLTDAKKCERVCPQGINLLKGDSLSKCTKCMECYIECDKGAISIEVKGRSEALSSLKNFIRHRKQRNFMKQA